MLINTIDKPCTAGTAGGCESLAWRIQAEETDNAHGKAAAHVFVRREHAALADFAEDRQLAVMPPSGARIAPVK